MIQSQAEKSFEFPSKKISISINCSDEIYLWFNINTLERIISNFWNNSIEASSKQNVSLWVEVAQINQETRIRFIDDSGGFPQRFFEQLKSGKVETSKTYGYGIGIQHALNEIEASEGAVQFSNNDRGAVVDLLFGPKSFASKSDPIILIDDDKYIRHSWMLAAEKSGQKIYSFSCYQAFLQANLDFDHNMIEFFIDSDLGDSMSGQDIIRELTLAGYKRINLQTGSEPDEFSSLVNLNSILSKTYPYA